MPGRAEDGRRPSPLLAGLRFDGKLGTWKGHVVRRGQPAPAGDTRSAGRAGPPPRPGVSGTSSAPPPAPSLHPRSGLSGTPCGAGSRANSEARSDGGSGDGRGLCPAPPPPGGRAVAGFGSRLRRRGLRPAQASARRRNREGEGAGCQRRRPEGGAFSLSGFLLRNTWFLQVRETQASERGAALPDGAAAPSRPHPPDPGTPTPPCFKPQAL